MNEIQSQPHKKSGTLQIADGAFIGNRRLYHRISWAIYISTRTYTSSQNERLWQTLNIGDTFGPTFDFKNSQ